VFPNEAPWDHGTVLLRIISEKLESRLKRVDELIAKSAQGQRVGRQPWKSRARRSSFHRGFVETAYHVFR
jgi:hypothetical protein